MHDRGSGTEGSCQVTIIGGMVNKKFTHFAIFRGYLGKFLMFLHEIFIGRKVLSSLGADMKSFD